MTGDPPPLTHGVVAVIPARFGSSRFPGKPLAPILGVPLVLRVHARVASALPRDQIVVATDDTRIRDVCAAEGVRAIMTSSACMTGTDRVWEAARALDAEIVLNVQGDEPLIHADDVLTVLRAKREHPGHVVNAMCVVPKDVDVRNTNVPKVVVRGDGQLVYMSRAPVPFSHDPLIARPFLRQVCIYAFTRSELDTFAGAGARTDLEAVEDIEILRFIDLGVPVHMVRVGGASTAVDVPSDVGRVEHELRLEGSAGDTS